MTASPTFSSNSPSVVINQGEHERTKRLTEQYGKRKGQVAETARRETKRREMRAVMLVYSGANVVRDWERRNQLGKKGEEFNKET